MCVDKYLKKILERREETKMYSSFSNTTVRGCFTTRTCYFPPPPANNYITRVYTDSQSTSARFSKVLHIWLHALNNKGWDVTSSRYVTLVVSDLTSRREESCVVLLCRYAYSPWTPRAQSWRRTEAAAPRRSGVN